MALGRRHWSLLRRRVTSLLQADGVESATLRRVEPLLLPMNTATMRLPAVIGDYTDFYASLYHATNVGRLFRPDNPVLPNFKYVPIGYHGRSSSMVRERVFRSPVLKGRRRTQLATCREWAHPQARLRNGRWAFSSAPGIHFPSPFLLTTPNPHIFGLCLLNDLVGPGPATPRNLSR